MADIHVLNSEDDLITAANVFRAAMIGFPPLSDLPPGKIAKLLEPGRTVGAFVDGRIVGTADAATSDLTLPGGAVVGHAAVTHVGVLPSFTRRGIATDLMRHQLHDIAARGEVVATLRASEATIYERYGYGVASSSQAVEVHTARAALRPDVGVGGPVRLIDAAEAWDVLPRICADNRPSRPGTVDRPAVWWQGLRLRTEASTEPTYFAVHGEPGSESGFVRYHPVDAKSWLFSEQRKIVVEDFFAPTFQAYLGLLRFLLELDLVDRVVFWSLPLDDPLPHLLVDRRAARISGLFDETWLRVVDTGRALSARRYTGDDAVVISVDDPLLPDNSGTFVICGDGAEPTDRRADLQIDVAGLAAVLLGGTTWRTLAVAGRARADDPAALAIADELFAVQQAPHAGIFF
ncbi:GNAT family N-acetyltransferase [Mycobacterium shimoidei]|uniref:GNAT family N-acetyltransferase n=1 Tax=Mycobacterium shimoidei TaxID=29313 RepID=UPI0008494885|nr:GNAT family N-acetyltransferase [Mycobacterium shimoidei]MCV7258570.1 GNAT family N-acetyltransferase [Mycobacterium shimoidei]ODR15485.1 GNAT family N-acetyltransferase [Mycobacterium shimoidei]ORW83656.1 GNAT family acetyltransferase [Mycobacterium shimoidei]